MGQTRPVGEKERQNIINALRGGESLHSVAKRFKRGKSTIHNIAKAAGLDLSSPQTASAAQARSTYSKAERIRLIDKALAKTEEMLDKGEVNTKGFYSWTLGLAVLIDKRRQEDDDGGKRRGAISELIQRLREEEADAGTADG